MRILASCLMFAFLAMQSAAGGEMVLHLGQYAIHAEVAATPQQRDQGLMHRARLCADCGMLFVFPAAARYAFWMKDTPLPLSIAFIAPDGRIINISEMQRLSTERHEPAGDALYALEMNRHWFARHGIKPGDKVDGVSVLPAAPQ